MTQVKQKSSFAAAAHVLGYDTLSWVVGGRIDYENERIDWDTIFARRDQLSDGEQHILDIALALWNGDTAATIASLALISDEPYTRIIQALIALRGIELQPEPAEIAGEAISLFIEDVKNTVPWTGLADLSDELISKSRDAAVREIVEGLSVTDKDLEP